LQAGLPCWRPEETTVLTGRCSCSPGSQRGAAAPCQLIGGTADHFWDGQVARSVTTEVIEIDGADHGMFVPGRMAASAAVLGQVITAVEDFLDHTAWP
jgi:hypothetical protein